MSRIAVKFFSIMDYEEEGKYLSQMHEKGLKFSKVVFPGIYFFDKCTPEDVCYQLDYNQDRLKENDEYIQMFEDCGWEYVLDFMGYSYFRKPAAEMSGEEMIFCDDDSRVEMIKRVFRGRMIPLIILFCFCLLPLFIFATVNNSAGDFTGLQVLLGAVIILYIAIFTKFMRSYRQFKKRMEI